MKNKQQILFKWVVAIIISVLSGTMPLTSAWADKDFEFAVAPMYEKIILNPGDSFTDSFEIANPISGNSAINYKADVGCYYVDEKYNNLFNEDSSWCSIKDWITINSNSEGSLNVNEKNTLTYTINVPKDAVGGGQYATIMITANSVNQDTETDENQNNNENLQTGIKEEKTIAYLIYAEITGDVIRKGEILDANVPSFLLSGNITGSAAVKNTGNIHGDATYKLQVFPLFSNEEIYTNEEDPKEVTVLPDRTRYEEITWEQTPSIGIFNVVFTTEFEGATAQVSKLVIKCPIWLLFTILAIIAGIIIWIVMRIRSHNNKTRKSTDNDE